jgi:hypothetical protein
VLDVRSVLQRELQRRHVRPFEPVVSNVRQFLLDERGLLFEALQQRRL